MNDTSTSSPVRPLGSPSTDPLRSGAVGEAAFEIRTLESAAEMATIQTILQQVWGTTTPIVSVELLCAIGHSGGYVAAAYDSGRLIGASFGFLGRHRADLALHSHVTGILPGVQHGGIGRAMKNHQRDWAAERDIGWITWTFDPLVRRNAWFNIEVLGAHVAEYLVQFYGPMGDAINANDESDRLLVAWPTSDAVARPTPRAGAIERRIATPDDIVVLRRRDPDEALVWRHRLRAELGDRLADGAVVTGFTRDGDYVLAHVAG
jgi:predicted GNAT superfamily acetyltransferase